MIEIPFFSVLMVVGKLLFSAATAALLAVMILFPINDQPTSIVQWIIWVIVTAAVLGFVWGLFVFNFSASFT